MILSRVFVRAFGFGLLVLTKISESPERAIFRKSPRGRDLAEQARIPFFLGLKDHVNLFLG
jgi:hypothetical protein